MLKMFQKDFFLQLGFSIIIALLQFHHQVRLKIVYTLLFLPSCGKFFCLSDIRPWFSLVVNLFHVRFFSVAVRVETGVEQGDTVSMHYDPMIAKLVVWGGNRGEALVKLKDCLSNFQVLSLTTCNTIVKALWSHY